MRISSQLKTRKSSVSLSFLPRNVKYESRTACRSTRGTRRPWSSRTSRNESSFDSERAAFTSKTHCLAGPGREPEEVGIDATGPAAVDRPGDPGGERRAGWPARERCSARARRSSWIGPVPGIATGRRRLRRTGGDSTGVGGGDRDSDASEPSIRPTSNEAPSGRTPARSATSGWLVPELELAVVARPPDLDGAVLGQRDEPRAVGRERQPDDRAFVGEPGHHHRVDLGLLARDEPPDADVVVGARRPRSTGRRG